MTSLANKIQDVFNEPGSIRNQWQIREGTQEGLHQAARAGRRLPEVARSTERRSPCSRSPMSRISCMVRSPAKK